MPRIIRQALGERVHRDPDLQRLLADVSEATGVPVAYAGPLGHCDEAPTAKQQPLCARLRATSAGCGMCARFRQGLFESATLEPKTGRCGAGLQETAVPLRAANQTLGYLVIGGHLSESLSTALSNRSRHLLARAGVGLSDAEVEDLLRRTTVITPQRQAALMNVLQLAAEHMTAKITDRLVQPEASMPPLVERTCRIIHAEFAHPVVVPELARRLDSSEGHLSRTFHRATGLRLVEYVARYRSERARVLLRETERPITDIAFACGFQSLSQFHRVFRAQFGKRPRDIRAEVLPCSN